ncbi:MAG: hypothetical protein NWR26_05070, partial [Pseudomonadales bacterium]|nr:hypothetical protein [Pseudomonadales bacterium]
HKRVQPPRGHTTRKVQRLIFFNLKFAAFFTGLWMNQEPLWVGFCPWYQLVLVDSQAGFSMFSADSIYLWDKQQHRQPHNLLFFKISF